MGDDTWTQVRYRRGRMVPNRQTRFPNDGAYPGDSADRLSYRTGRNQGRFPSDGAYPRGSADRRNYRTRAKGYDYQNRQNDNRGTYHSDGVYRSHPSNQSRDQRRPTYAEASSRFRPRQFDTQFRPRQFEKRYRFPPPPRTGDGDVHSLERPDVRAPRMAASPQLRTMAKHMTKLIRLTHHLQKVASDEDLPVTFRRLENYLSEVIRPAYPSPLVQQLLTGNAKNWVHTTRVILKEHYELAIKQVVEELVPTLRGNWRLAFDIAKRWARQGLGRRLTSDAISQAEAMITAECPATFTENNTNQRSTDTEIQTLPTNTDKTLVDIDVQTSPLARGRDWTFDEDFPPLPPPGSSLILQPTSMERRETRTHRTQNPCAQDEVIMEVVLCPPTQNTGQDQQRQTELPNPRPVGVSSPKIIQVHQEEETSLIQLEQELHDTTPSRHNTTANLGISPILTRHLPAGTSLQFTTDSTPTAADKPIPTCKPIRHINTNRKMVDWSLSVRKKWVIIGDSNLSRMPSYEIPDLQIDSFPGATFLHAETLIKKATVSAKVEKIVLAFGLNHREQKAKETAIKQLQRAIKAAKRRFPHAEIWIPIVNFSRNISLRQQDALETLNRHIRTHTGFIPPLVNTEFQVESRDMKHIHWTSHTAKAMLQHWATHLNFIAP